MATKVYCASSVYFMPQAMNYFQLSFVSLAFIHNFLSGSNVIWKIEYIAHFVADHSSFRNVA